MSAALVGGSELSKTVLSRMWEEGLFVSSQRVLLLKITMASAHSYLECSYIFDFWNIELWMVFNKSDGTCRKKLVQ